MKTIFARFVVSLFMVFGLSVPTFGILTPSQDSSNVRIDDSGVFMQCSPITQLTWGGPDYTPTSTMFGTCFGGWSVFAGNNAAQITMVPGNGDTQYWYITGYQNNRGMRIYNDQTLVENQLVAQEDFTVEGNSFLAGTVEASNFSGSSSGTNTGDQSFVMLLTGSGESNSVAAGATVYMGPGTSHAPVSNNSIVATVIPFDCTLAGLNLTTTGAQPSDAPMIITVQIAGSSTPISITVMGGSSTFGDSTHSTNASVGSKISLKVVNNSTSPSAKIDSWSLGCKQR